MRVVARQLVDLLAARHADAVFVSECKDGPTHNTEHRRIDAWAMDKSWRNPCIYGYEVKVSLSDFSNDTKWRDYLPMCNKFFFVCPWKLIDKSLLPPGVGLLYANQKLTGLVQRQPAAYREDDSAVLDNVFRYILMCRVKIHRGYEIADNAEFWRKWREERDSDKELGHACSRTIRRLVSEQINGVRLENGQLRKRIKELEELDQWCKDNHINLSYMFSAQNRVRELTDAVPESLLGQIRDSATRLLALEKQLTGLRERHR